MNILGQWHRTCNCTKNFKSSESKIIRSYANDYLYISFTLWGNPEMKKYFVSNLRNVYLCYF